MPGLLTNSLLLVLTMVGLLVLVVTAVLFYAYMVFPLVGAGILVLGYAVLGRFVYSFTQKAAQRRAPMDQGTAAGREALLRRLQRTDIFRSLSRQHLGTVADLGRTIRVTEGATLATALEGTETVYAVLEGHAELHAPSRLGDLTMRVAGPGEAFPLASIVGSGKVITSARAMSDMDLFALPSTRLRELLASDPEMGARVYQMVASILAERYRRTLQRLTAATEGALKQADIWANV